MRRSLLKGVKGESSKERDEMRRGERRWQQPRMSSYKSIISKKKKKRKQRKRGRNGKKKKKVNKQKRLRLKDVSRRCSTAL